jgi:VanZ family protein
LTSPGKRYIYCIVKTSARHTILVLYVLAMVLAFLFPVPPTPIPVAGGFDKVVHFGLFLGFALLYSLDSRPSVGRVLLVSLAFAGGIELIQWALPYRSHDWWDFTVGAAGAGVGTALGLLVRAR